MNFLKKEHNVNIDEAIKFIKEQRKIQKKNIKRLKDINYVVDKIKDWIEIYDYVLDILYTIKKDKSTL